MSEPHIVYQSQRGPFQVRQWDTNMRKWEQKGRYRTLSEAAKTADFWNDRNGRVTQVIDIGWEQQEAGHVDS